MPPLNALGTPLQVLLVVLALAYSAAIHAEKIDLPIAPNPLFGSFPGKHGEVSVLPITITRNDSGERSGSVIVVHGCNGPNGASYRDWGRYLSQNGFNAIEVDLFRERGLSNVCADGLEGSLTSRSSVREIESLAGWVKAQSWSNGKVGVVGFSMGGGSVLSAASLGLSEPLRKSSLDAAIAYYPNCRNYSSRGLLVPMQIHIGKQDDWTPAEPCESLGNFWGKGDPSAAVFIYENAHHGFDQDGLNASFKCPRGTCTGRYDGNSNNLSRERAIAFLREMLGK